ncbi:MAG: LolA family protein, partial [Bryobacteraceae bacterium]
MRRAVLLISICLPLVGAETPEARRILERSRTAFKKLESFEIAAVTVVETSSADFEQRMKSKMMLAAEQQEKFHFESKGMGGLVKISDGSTIWTYNAFLKQYTKTTA